MEASTSKAAATYNYGDKHRGAVGKFRKPPSRKPPPSPYARPLAAPVNNSGSGRWLSKLFDPACRLISGTATRIIPSFLSRATSDALPPVTRSNEGDEVIPSAKDEEKCTSSPAAFASTERMDVNELVEKEDGIHQEQKQGQDRPENSHDKSEISRIEQLMKGKSFSKEEINRLTELLKARAIDDVEKDKPSRIPGPITPLPQAKVKDEVGASPIDVARAYMGSRRSNQNFLNKGEQDHFVPPPLPKPSPCWPGTMAGLTTPQTQRSRHGLHDFPRTPYSRTLLSKSRTNGFSAQSFQQSPMAKNSQERAKTTMFDQGYGSVGPIRRIRNKLGSEPRSKNSIFMNPSKTGSEIEKSPLGVKDTKETETSKTIQNEASRIILEHISRHKPTPKEKAYELNLATCKSLNVSSTTISDQPPPPPPPTSGTKPNLSAIAITKPDQRHNIFSNPIPPPTGFTFPVPAASSGVFSEPPTPSMPSSATKVAPDGTVPSFSFGNGKSSQALVFSFPSSSSASASAAGASDAIKFSFGGGDGKTRLCFNAAVC